MKFLIVDDSKAMRAIVIRSLKKAGYHGHQFEQAEDGVEALKLIREWGPHVVLTDWHMPNMDGLQLLQQIKEEKLDMKVGMVTTERVYRKNNRSTLTYQGSETDAAPP